MPKVTIVNSKLTIMMPKYSAPFPVKCSCSGARGEAARSGDSLSETLSIDPIPFEFYRCSKSQMFQIGYHKCRPGRSMVNEQRSIPGPLLDLREPYRLGAAALEVVALRE